MKKNIYNVIVSLAMALFLSGCTDDQAFDATAAERIRQRLDEISSTLLSSQSGWALDYYLPADVSIPMICRFDDRGNIEISRYLVGGSNSVEKFGTVIKSSYVVEYGIGPTLSLNTYNELLHPYCDPKKDGVGNMGDYEFIVTELHDDYLVLRGKKHGTISYLWRLPEHTLWGKYLEDNAEMLGIAQSKLVSNWRRRLISYDGKTEELTYNLLQGFGFPSDIKSEDAEYYNFAVTDNSIRFQHPLLINGERVYEFEYDEVSDEFRALNADAVLSKGALKLNEQFHYNGRWFVKGNDMCPLYRTEWQAGMKMADCMTFQLGSAKPSAGEPAITVTYIIVFYFSYGNFYYEFLPVEGTDDVVRIRYLNSMDAGGAYLMGMDTGPYMWAMTNIIGGAGQKALTYKIVVDEGTAEEPSKMTLTNIENPEHYFSVYPTSNGTPAQVTP